MRYSQSALTSQVNEPIFSHAAMYRYTVDFWAPWCGPCRLIGPVVEEPATQYAGQLKVGKLNVDEQSEIAQRYGISGIPALLFFDQGQVVDTVVGAVPKGVLQKHVQGVINR